MENEKKSFDQVVQGEEPEDVVNRKMAKPTKAGKNSQVGAVHNGGT